MIYYKTSDGVIHEITKIRRKGDTAINEMTFLYRKDLSGSIRLLWEAINSCFGSGYWIDAKPWSDTDGWRDLP